MRHQYLFAISITLYSILALSFILFDNVKANEYFILFACFSMFFGAGSLMIGVLTYFSFVTAYASEEDDFSILQLAIIRNDQHVAKKIINNDNMIPPLLL